MTRDHSKMHPEHPVPSDWTPESLRLLVANVWVGNPRLTDDLDLFRSLDVDVVGVSEGEKIPQTAPWGFRRFRTGDGGRYSREVPILQRRSPEITVHGRRYLKAAPGIRDHKRPGHEFTKVGKPRWISVVRLKVRGRRVAVVNTHMHAAVVGKSGRPRFGSMVVRQYRQHMKALLQVVREERAAGWEPVVLGDLNYPERGRSWKWSPAVALKRAGLRYVQHRVDGFAADPEVFEISHALVEPKGSDHDKYVLGRLTWRD